MPRRHALLLAGAAAVATSTAVSAGALVVRALGPTASPFEDVADGADGLEAMIWADRTGVLPAVEGSFAPDSPVTRGEIAAALHRFAGTPEVLLEGTPVLIADLDEAADHAPALLWLHGRGALWGDAELKVRPAEPATRDGAAGMLAALLRPALAGVGARWEPSAETSSAAGDATALPTELPRDAAWLAAAGMVPRPDGTVGDGEDGDGSWHGEAGVTRAELAAALHRADGIIADALG